MIAKEERLTSVKAAEYVGVSSNFIRMRAKDGRLPCIQIGSRYYFAKADLDKLIVVKGPHELNGQLDI